MTTSPGRPLPSGSRILVVRLAGIGDVVMASTLVERIRREQPDAHITFLTGRVAEPIARLFDVDEVIAIDETSLLRGGWTSRAAVLLSLWRQLGARRFDRVLLLHVDRRYRALLAGLRPVRVDMLTRAQHGEMIPVPGRWLGDEYARLLDGNRHVGPIERRFDLADLRGQVTRLDAGAGAVVLVPGGAANVLRSDDVRRWPTTHYAQLAERLLDAGHGVVLIGGPGDRWVLPAFDGMSVRSMIGELSLVETLSLLRAAAVVVTHDTGPLHLARLVRTPVVALFGPTMPAQFLSFDDSVTVIWGGEFLACRPCYDGREFAACSNNICLSSITSAAVFEAVATRLKAPVPT
jgi:heptosyltransferase-2